MLTELSSSECECWLTSQSSTNDNTNKTASSIASTSSESHYNMWGHPPPSNPGAGQLIKRGLPLTTGNKA